LENQGVDGMILNFIFGLLIFHEEYALTGIEGCSTGPF